jgi:hypothetical protein
MCDTAADSWEALKDAYEGITRTNLHQLHTSVINLKFDDRAATISDHITEYEKRWCRLSATTKTATDLKSYAGALKVLTTCETAKSSLLLATLPPFYNNIVDNLTTKETLHHNDITVRLREIISTKKRATTNATQPGQYLYPKKVTKYVNGVTPIKDDLEKDTPKKTVGQGSEN